MATRDYICPITANEIEGVDTEEKGPLRTLKRRASEILGISDQHPSVTAARRRSSGELGQRLSISGATRRVSVPNQDESGSVTSVSPSTDIVRRGSARKRKYTVGGLLVEVNELENITNGSVDDPVTDSDINVDSCSRSEGRESEGGGGGHRSLQVGFVIPAVIPETIL
uniref:Uncharacterized protein n=1 Tax=Amphimedon queenslandica TaxID=400682 RepID=A0A1X7SJL3_AMPQE